MTVLATWLAGIIAGGAEEADRYAQKQAADQAADQAAAEANFCAAQTKAQAEGCGPIIDGACEDVTDILLLGLERLI